MKIPSESDYCQLYTDWLSGLTDLEFSHQKLFIAKSLQFQLGSIWRYVSDGGDSPNSSSRMISRGSRLCPTIHAVLMLPKIQNVVLDSSIIEVLVKGASTNSDL